jgi:ElaB/YqjD/DUF883 family membrane-anchored ribosome-binding protein
MNAKDKTMNENIDDTMDAARDKMDEAKSKVTDMSGKASEKVRAVASDLSAKASDAATAVRDTAVERMDEARDALSESGDRLAETLRRAAEEPEAGSVQARVLSAVASGVSTAAGTLRDRSVSDIAADLRDMARRNPGVFAAGAAVAGFALARFLRASQRRERDYPYGDMRIGQSTYQPGQRTDEGRS